MAVAEVLPVATARKEARFSGVGEGRRDRWTSTV